MDAGFSRMTVNVGKCWIQEYHLTEWWVFEILMFVAVIAIVYHARRQLILIAKRCIDGRCDACGYDLRASQGTHLECGAEILFERQ